MRIPYIRSTIRSIAVAFIALVLMESWVMSGVE
jgi:hypothetical protein